MTGAQVDLPDPSRILPYLDLYTLVILQPAVVAGLVLLTPYFPPLSIFKNGQFRRAPTRAVPTNPNVARIFDPIATAANDHPPLSPGYIPLSSHDSQFRHQRYWRLPIKTEIILAMLINRFVSNRLWCELEELHLVESIYARLLLRIAARLRVSRGGRGGRGRGRGRGNGGRGAGGRGANKSRTLENDSPREPQRKKARLETHQALYEEPVLKFRVAGEGVEQASDQSREQNVWI